VSSTTALAAAAAGFFEPSPAGAFVTFSDRDMERAEGEEGRAKAVGEVGWMGG